MNETSKSNDYRLTICSPGDLSNEELAVCISIIKTGGAVDLASAAEELSLARTLALARKDHLIVAVGAIKRIRRRYAAIVAKRSGKDFVSETPELGYIAVAPDHQGFHLSSGIVSALLSEHDGALFATTSNSRMKAT